MHIETVILPRIALMQLPVVNGSGKGAYYGAAVDSQATSQFLGWLYMLLSN